jgi:WD40 repeat protein
MKSPFKFLDSFAKEDREIFFGREKEIEELYRRVFRSKIMLVYGVSGTGKSSLINCGLANKFRDEDWLPVNVRRGRNMPESMYSAIVSASLTPRSEYVPSEIQFKKYVKSLYLDHYKPVFFIFDQFEELFIFGSRDERSLFVRIIKALVDSDIQCHFIFVMREEYMASVTEFEKHIPAFFANRVRIENMDINNAIQAIKGPCRVADIAVEEGFPEALIETLSPGSPDIELTYLQVFLDKIYRLSSEEAEAAKEAGGKISFTLEQLRKAGNVSDLLGTFLNEQIALLEDPDAALAVLKSFVSVKGTKRQMTLDDVKEYAQTLGKPISEAALLGMLQNFVNLRILRDKDQNERYELRHDSLATKIFEKISGVEKDILEIRQFIEDGYHNWQKRGVLLSGSDLEYIAPYESRLFLSSDLLNLITQSKNQLEKTKRKRRVIFVGATSVLLIAFACFTIWALLERNKANLQRRVAVEKKNESNSNLYASYSFNQLEKNQTLSFRLAEKALEVDKNNISAIKAVLNSYYAGSFFKVIAEFNNDLNCLKLSPENNYIVTIPFRSDNINIWDIKGNKIRDYISKDGSVIDVSFSPNEKYLITSGYKNSVGLFDINGNIINRLSHKMEYFIPSCFSSDNKLFATGDINSLKIWDLEGKLKNTYNKPGLYPDNVALSSDGKYILYGAYNAIGILDLTNNEWKTLNEHKKTGFSAIISSDNKYILSAGKIEEAEEQNDSIAILWKINGEKIRSFKSLNKINSIAFSPKSNYFAIGDFGGNLRIYNFHGDLINEIKTNQIGISQIQFTKDEKSIYTISKDSKSILLWNLSSKEPPKIGAHRKKISSIEFSPNGKYIVTSSYDSTAILWTTDGGIKHIFKGHSDIINSAQFSYDSKMIVTAGDDNLAIIWDLDGKIILKYKFDEYPVEFASFSSDNKMVAMISPANICRIIDLKGNLIGEYRWKVDYSWNVGYVRWRPRQILLDSLGNEIKYYNWHKAYVNSANFSKGRKYVITASDDSTAIVWDLKGNKILSLNGHNDKVVDAEFSRDDQKILTATADNTLRLWDRKGQLLAIIKGTKEFLRYASFSYDSKKIETQSLKDTIRVYDLNGKLLEKNKWDRLYISSVFFSNDGKKILTSSRDGTGKLWDLKTKKYIELGESIYASYSPNGNYIATITDGDHVSLWDELGNKIQTFPVQSDIVNSVKFSPDGRLILTSCGDNTARLWDLQGNEIQTFNGSGKGVTYASFSPDGKYIAVANNDNTFQLWLINANDIIGLVNADKNFGNSWELDINSKKKFNIDLTPFETLMDEAKISAQNSGHETDTLKKIKYLLNSIEKYKNVMKYAPDSLSQNELKKVREDISNVYKDLTFNLIYKKDFKNAYDYAMTGLTYNPSNGLLQVYEAILLIIDNHFDKASDIILNLKGKPFQTGDEEFNDIILSFVNSLERADIKHTDFLKLRLLITK